MATSRTVSPAKLSSGAWGARPPVTGGPVAIGEIVTIRTAAGKEWQAKVTGTDGGLLVTVSMDRAPAAAAPRYTPAATRSSTRPAGWRPCGYPGCNPGYCDECDGEGYRAGRSSRRW